MRLVEGHDDLSDDGHELSGHEKADQHHCRARHAAVGADAQLEERQDGGHADKGSGARVAAAREWRRRVSGGGA